MATCSSCGGEAHLSRRDVEMIDTMISIRMRQMRMPIGRDGIIVSGSYDPKDGTVKVTFGDTAAMFPDTSDEQIDHPRIPLVNTTTNRQTPPRGGERVVVYEAQGGPVAHFIVDEDDSLGTPSGEDWAVHRNAAGVIDAYQKFTNDGSTAGDGKGGIQTLVGAFGKIFTTAGWSFSLDDSGQKMLLVSPNGQTITMDDAAALITIGAGTANAIMRDVDVTNALNAFSANIKSWCSLNFQSGASAPATGPTVPSVVGSNKVKSA